MKIKRIAIVGAGTAGWLAANHLGAELSADSDIEITVIESKDVPSIGVGEGTVPYVMNGLKRFGISEAELLLTCDTTFKQGIKFVNWLDSEVHGKDNYYHHPFDEPFPQGTDINRYWLTQSRKMPYTDVGIQARVCDLGLAPKSKSAGEYQGELAYAYHFNAEKFAQLLAKNAKNRFSVKHQIATITDAECNPSGDIARLIDKDGNKHDFDFYVDCSGFSSVLIEKTLSVSFVSKADELLTDTALVQQMPIAADESLPPYTTATAHSAGWIWDIPLTTRRGTGFVYSSKHMSEAEAKTEYAKYLGVDDSSFSPRKIPMKIGYRKQFWQNNCVALGLAQGFVEPLEATSILVTDFSAEMLAKNFPRQSEEINSFQPYYNEVITYVWDRVIDFIKLHYCISDRTDSQFWIDNRKPETLSVELKARLNKFSLRPPMQSDFFSRFDLFNHKNFLYVLYGMKYSTKSVSITEQERQHSANLLQQNQSIVEQAKGHFLQHKDWLNGLKAAASRTN